MNIYIYGNQNFNKEIQEVLERANIKFKLDSDSFIQEITSLEDLKNTIKEKPKDIYLIDDEKIIKKNSINKKIKFLTPKDGIEEEFLLDNGIADLSIDSIQEIPKYILNKYEEEQNISVNSNIQDSIINIVDEAYEQNAYEESKNLEEEIKKEEIDFELDDELSQLLSKNEEQPVLEQKDYNIDVNLDKVDNLMETRQEDTEDVSIDEFSQLINFENDVGLNNTTLDYDDKNILNEDDNKEDEIEEKDDFFEGDKMNDKFSQLDSLNEKDILEAISTLNVSNENFTKKSIEQSYDNKQKEVLSVDKSNINDISEIITQLLNNKTLEITIKIKE